MNEALAQRSPTRTLSPFVLIVFLGYLAVGVPLSTLPVQVHATLGFGTAAVGAAVGMAAVATLLTRALAGSLSDRHGPKPIVVLGLGVAALSGVAYLLSIGLPAGWSLAALFAGRGLLGLGDSLFTTGLAAWAVSRVGPQHAGRAFAWIGIAMYGALALGAPLGAALDEVGGFGAVAAASGLAPLFAIPVALALRGLPGGAQAKAPFLAVLAAIWPPGLALVLASSGFGAIAAFLALRYAAQGWPGAGLALTAFGAAYILARVCFAGLPDRLGGFRVATACLAVQAAGLLLIAAAGSARAALAGAALAGFGYSLVFPSLGVEAVRRVPAASRSTALGAFLACFDLGVGLGGPMTGVVAGGVGLPAAFVAAGGASAASIAVIAFTRRGRAAPPA